MPPPPGLVTFLTAVTKYLTRVTSGSKDFFQLTVSRHCLSRQQGQEAAGHSLSTEERWGERNVDTQLVFSLLRQGPQAMELVLFIFKMGLPVLLRLSGNARMDTHGCVSTVILNPVKLTRLTIPECLTNLKDLQLLFPIWTSEIC